MLLKMTVMTVYIMLRKAARLGVYNMYRCTDRESPLFILYRIESNRISRYCVPYRIESVNTVS